MSNFSDAFVIRSSKVIPTETTVTRKMNKNRPGAI
jgi:hypothetical protein